MPLVHRAGSTPVVGVRQRGPWVGCRHAVAVTPIALAAKLIHQRLPVGYSARTVASALMLVVMVVEGRPSPPGHGLLLGLTENKKLWARREDDPDPPVGIDFLSRCQQDILEDKKTEEDDPGHAVVEERNIEPGAGPSGTGCAGVVGQREGAHRRGDAAARRTRGVQGRSQSLRAGRLRR